MKRKIISIKMDANETVAYFISWMKDIKKKLENINEIVADADLVMITMNGMTSDYQMFITQISVREKILKFEQVTGISPEWRSYVNGEEEILQIKRKSFTTKHREILPLKFYFQIFF